MTDAMKSDVALLGGATDRSGRKEIGAAVTERGVRFSLLFDTGVLLASEREIPGFVLDDNNFYPALDRRDGPTPANGVHV